MAHPAGKDLATIEPHNPMPSAMDTTSPPRPQAPRGRWWSGSRRPSPPSLLVVGAAMAVAVAVFRHLDWSRTAPRLLGADATVWIGQARDCIELGVCHAHGAASSQQLDTGVVWTDFLMLAQLVHATSFTERSAVFGLLSLGVATVFVVVWRWLGLAVALLTALASGLVLGAAEDPGHLWNPSLSFFPCALFFAALLVAAWTGRRGAIVVASVSWALAINTHLAALAFAPSLIAVPIMAGQRPVKSPLLALAVALTTSMIVAPGSTLFNVLMIREVLHTGILVGGGLATVLVAGLGRPLFLRAGAGLRAVIVAAAMLLPWMALYAWNRSANGLHFVVDLSLLQSSYGLPVIAPGMLAVAALSILPLRYIASRLHQPWVIGVLLELILAAGVGSSIARTIQGRALSLEQLVAHANPAEQQGFSHEDARHLARYVEAHGWDPTRLDDHLQNKACHQALSAIGTYANPPRPPPPGFDPLLQLRLWLIPNARIPEGLPSNFDRVPLGDGRTAIFSSVHSWLDVANERYCQPRDGGEECIHPHQNVRPARTQPFQFTQRSSAWYPPPMRTADADESIVIPLRSTGTRREFTLYTQPICPWTFGRVEGLEVEHTAAGDHIRISGVEGTAATITLVHKRATCMGWEPRPPCLMENDLDDPESLSRGDVSQ